MHDKISIRNVKPGDEKFLFNLMNNISVMRALNEVPTEESDWREAVSVWRQDKDEEGYIVMDDQKPIGWFSVNGLLSEDQERDGGPGKPYLKMAALLPEYQNKNIGAYVLMQILGKLKKEGVAFVSLYTNQDNLRAQKCYEKCGFRITEALTQKMSDGTMAKRYKMECTL